MPCTKMTVDTTKYYDRQAGPARPSELVPSFSLYFRREALQRIDLIVTSY